MLLQAALNGDRSQADHPAVPVTVDELARDAAACVAAGARAIHMHPRGADGREGLDVVDEVVVQVRDACGVPVGVSTGAWIEPDVERRLELVSAWREPDYASVNVSEEGWAELMHALTESGIGIEAGVWSVDDAERLAASGIDVLRVLVEDTGLSPVADIHAALDRGGISVPRLQHGQEESAWAVLEDALRRGLDTRVGLEDTLVLPSGDRTSGNEELVRAAAALLPVT